MRLGNHVVTGVAAALALGVPLQDVPLVIAGTILPHLLRRLGNRLPTAAEASHAVILWALVTLAAAGLLPVIAHGEIRLHPWTLLLGGLLHVCFDLLGKPGAPLLPRRNPFSLRLYTTGDVISEDTFVWLFAAAGVFLWLLKNH